MLQNSTRSSAFKRCFEVLYFILVQTLQSFDAIFWGQKKCQRIGLCLVPFGKEEGNMIHSLLKTCIVHRKTTSFSFEKIETFFPCISQGKSSLFILLCEGKWMVNFTSQEVLSLFLFDCLVHFQYRLVVFQWRVNDLSMVEYNLLSLSQRPER